MNSTTFNEEDVLHKLKHFLPAQAPLKDFIHHNTLHAFQDKPFFEALKFAKDIFGYKTLLTLSEYRVLYHTSKISEKIIYSVLKKNKNETEINSWFSKMMETKDNEEKRKRIGNLRKYWKLALKTDLDTLVHNNLFKLIGSYLDQGISINRFPIPHKRFITAIQELDSNSVFELFHSPRVKKLLCKKDKSLTELLIILVGDARYFEQYLFDQQFTHPGWSGIVSAIENNPKTLLDIRKVTLFDFIYLELLLEIDALDSKFKDAWQPIAELTKNPPVNIFDSINNSLNWELKTLWQQAFEWSYYDQVLGAINIQKVIDNKVEQPRFQAFFCIDDREESIRRHIEKEDPKCETFGTPGHFALEIKFQPEKGKFSTQVCPNPITPSYLIKEENNSIKRNTDIHFYRGSHDLLTGWVISQTVGFWSVVKLFLNLFNPTVNAAHSSSFEHVHPNSTLITENTNGLLQDDLKVGFTVEEMAGVVLKSFRSTGFVTNFASIVYYIGHGGSSTNNPYYAGYNCGACSGRPGSVNARVFAEMANRKDVRELVEKQGINIPESTIFIGGLHDTTRDEFVFYDVENLSENHKKQHSCNQLIFNRALAKNAKERARQFTTINIHKSETKILKEVKKRSVALFEPRPELNHSNNSLCIVANRQLTKHIFLDQRAFLNSYDWKADESGEILSGILNAATPVCGGINLEYYFSRVDNQNFGAGSKLPHNVVGLFGVANGIEGDLRTGLPTQMIDVHDPVRLMMIVEQKPAVVLKAISQSANTYEWYKNDWVKLTVINPENQEILLFNGSEFVSYNPIQTEFKCLTDLMPIFETTSENLPVFQLN